MQNKKGITLSVNFLVVIILALVILGFSVYFLASIISRAKGLGEMTQQDLDKKIESIQCEGIVCIPINYKQIERGKFDIFGIKIYNNKGEFHTFKVEVNAVSKNVLGILWAPKELDVPIRTNEEKRIGIGFQIEKNTPPGIYIFNVKVYDQSGEQYGSTAQIRIGVA